uniref:Uncharacterized protein n=1 Tax=Solanum lycopersicum TaxID=4081 RepID=A0A3Q7EW84_SOLLC
MEWTEDDGAIKLRQFSLLTTRGELLQAKSGSEFRTCPVSSLLLHSGELEEDQSITEHDGSLRNFYDNVTINNSKYQKMWKK